MKGCSVSTSKAAHLMLKIDLVVGHSGPAQAFVRGATTQARKCAIFPLARGG